MSSNFEMPVKLCSDIYPIPKGTTCFPRNLVQTVWYVGVLEYTLNHGVKEKSFFQVLLSAATGFIRHGELGPRVSSDIPVLNMLYPTNTSLNDGKRTGAR